MRSGSAALLLLIVLPAMNVLAAPAPSPSAILDIGPPQRGETEEEHRNRAMDNLTHPYGLMVLGAWRDPEVRNLPSVAAWKDPRPWISKNLRVTWEGKGNCLRLTFRGGSYAEQAAIIDAVLRTYIRDKRSYLRHIQGQLKKREEDLPKLIELVENPGDGRQRDCNRRELERLRDYLPKLRAMADVYEQIAVVRWAE